MPAPIAAKPSTVQATVARGRTVVAGSKNYGPGAMVELPFDEVARLQARGFLVVPQAPETPVANGPTFEAQADRVTVS